MHEELGIDGLLQRSKTLSAWILERIDGLNISNLPHDKKLQLSMACQHLAIEHSVAIIILIDSERHGSALALVRPMFEAMVRGNWFRYTATDDDISKTEKDKFPELGIMVKGEASLQLIKDVWWKDLCGYTHTGKAQILARLDESGIRSNYKNEEIAMALQWADLTSLVSAIEMASAAHDSSLVSEFQERRDRMSIKYKLEKMHSFWERLGIVECFPKIHHFSTKEYNSREESMKRFYEYCYGIKNIQDQNTQTLDRALRFASLIENGQEFDSALESAWEEFPICTP